MWHKDRGSRCPAGLAGETGPGSEARTLTPVPWGWPEEWGCAPGEGPRLLKPRMLPWTDRRQTPRPRQPSGALRPWRASGGWPEPRGSQQLPGALCPPALSPKPWGAWWSLWGAHPGPLQSCVQRAAGLPLPLSKWLLFLYGWPHGLLYVLRLLGSPPAPAHPSVPRACAPASARCPPCPPASLPLPWLCHLPGDVGCRIWDLSLAGEQARGGRCTSSE